MRPADRIMAGAFWMLAIQVCLEGWHIDTHLRLINLTVATAHPEYHAYPVVTQGALSG